jgi:hypothetical protein
LFCSGMRGPSTGVPCRHRVSLPTLRVACHAVSTIRTGLTRCLDYIGVLEASEADLPLGERANELSGSLAVRRPSGRPLLPLIHSVLQRFSKADSFDSVISDLNTVCMDVGALATDFQQSAIADESKARTETEHATQGLEAARHQYEQAEMCAFHLLCEWDTSSFHL